MDSILADIRYSLRVIRKSPGIVAVAVISLGLGIGANVTIFSAVDVFMVRPLPYPDADRLLHVFSSVPDRGWMYNSMSIPDALDIREQSRTMDVAFSYGRGFNISGGDRPERADGERTTWNYFQVLQVQPLLGRTFVAEEERDGSHHVAILSYELWQRRFGGEREVIDRTILLDGEPHTVVGVLPAKFRFSQSTAELWTPIPITGEEVRGNHFLAPVARLRPGVELEQADQEAAAIADRLAAAYPESNDGWRAGARPLRELIFSPPFRTGSLVSSVAVAFVLLIACANVANLTLTRVAGRGREIAVRGALGAGRGRIVRQFLTEAMIVSLLGGTVGVAASIAGIRGFVALMPPWFPRVEDIGLSGRVLLFALVITLLTALIFGLGPALQAGRSSPGDALKEGGRGRAGSKADRLRKGLVVAEVALALTLLVASVLLVKGYLRLQTDDAGWDDASVLTFRLSLPAQRYADDEAVTGFYRELLPQLRAIPGVDSASGTSILPRWGNSNSFFGISGQEYPTPGDRPLTEVRSVFPGYFGTMGIPMRSGRALLEGDRLDAPPVAIVNQRLVDLHFPHEDPIGRHIDLRGETREIVGVVSTTLDVDQDPRPMTFLSGLQEPSLSMYFVLRTAADPLSVVDNVRQVILRMDADLPVYRVMSLADHIEQAEGGNTIMAKVMAVLALVAFVLAVVGVYGVMAYWVSQRTQEVGVRMALGAQRRDVLTLVVRQGAVVALTGVVIGLGLAAAATRSLSYFLFGVSPFDLAVFAGVTVILLVFALGATVLPGRRATRIDPCEALRYE
ncbi:MAG TPA: ABC transporter permease [Gemmatimonadales bacterium]|jgi:putative ABC transport system permease protein